MPELMPLLGGLFGEPRSEHTRLDGNLSGWMSRPFIHAAAVSGKTEIRGQRVWSGGHVLGSSSGEIPDGVFARWSAGEDGVEVYNDRYGFYPLYYFWNAREFVASPSVLTLLACGAPRDLDDVGLALFVRLGFFLREHTPFRHIRALPPGCRLRWSRGALQISGGAIPSSKPQELTRSAALDGFIELFAQSIKRRAPGSHPVALPLSGGRDSRHILFELLRQGHRPRWCVTTRHYPPIHDEDAAVAAQVTQTVGIPHVVVGQPRSRLRAESVKNAWTGFCTDEHAHLLPVVRALAELRAGSVYDGLAGTAFLGDFLKDEERVRLCAEGSFGALAEHLLRPEREETLASILSPRAYQRFNRKIAVDAVVAELRRHADAANPIGMFFFWNRTRREVALVPYCLYSGIDEVVVPFVDSDLYDFCSSLPMAMMVDRTFHTEAIRRAYPEYAHLRFWEKDLPAREDPWFVRRYAAGILARLLRRGDSQIVYRKSLLPRIARRALDGDVIQFGRIYPQLILCLHQLEIVARD